MAEYYPLISRAVAGLRTAKPESRQAIYDRAKQALVGQLRSMQPPVPEDAIERETTALDDAVARVEAELATSSPAGNLPLPRRPLADAPPVPSVAVPPPVTVSPSSAAQPTVAVEISSRSGASRSDQPRVPPRPTIPSRPAPPPASVPTAAESGMPAVGRDASAPTAAAGSSPVAIIAAAPVLPSAPTLRVSEPVSASTEPAASKTDGGTAAKERGEQAGDRDGDPARARDDVFRPAAPRPIERRRPTPAVWIVGLAALAAVIVIAFTAWRLRDNPQDLSRVPVATKAAEPTPGKLVERADAEGDANATTGSTSPANGDQTAGVSAPAIQATTTGPVAGSANGAGSPVMAVAQKAAILVDAPDDPQKVKTYVGTVLWRIENVSQGQDQPIGTAMRADIDIPDAKIQLVVQIRRNTEAQFPASHTIDVKFTVAADSPLSGIKQINVPQIRRQDMPTGEPLSGIPVTITDNYFLVGLTRGGPEQHNLELLATRGWIDIPMLLGSGKAAKITFEKGTQGDRVVADVLQAWTSAGN